MVPRKVFRTDYTVLSENSWKSTLTRVVAEEEASDSLSFFYI
jgi:hypothetical protein